MYAECGGGENPRYIGRYLEPITSRIEDFFGLNGKKISHAIYDPDSGKCDVFKNEKMSDKRACHIPLDKLPETPKIASLAEKLYRETEKELSDKAHVVSLELKKLWYLPGIRALIASFYATIVDTGKAHLSDALVKASICENDGNGGRLVRFNINEGPPIKGDELDMYMKQLECPFCK